MLSSSQVPRAARAIRPPMIPHPAPISSQPVTSFTYASDQICDPDEPIQTNIQQRMLLAFTDRGYWGLAMELYRQAEEKSNSNLKPASWRKIAVDKIEGHFTVYIQLLSLPEYIIPSLIRNTITYDRVRCRKIDSYIHSRMEPTVLPGIYVNILARGVPKISDHQKGIHNGVWLSSREAKDMVLSYEHYLKTGGSNDTRAQDIDNYMTAMPKKDRDAAKADPTFRRYAPSPSAREAARQWIEVISRLYVQNVDRAKTDVPFRRCVYEVGWGTNVKLRLDAHSMNRNTTYVYGYLNMWTRCILKPRFPPPQQLTLFRVWANDLQIAQVSEITASMLCSSYTTEGGLNPKEAGSSVVAKGKPHGHKHWKMNSEQVFQHSAHFHLALRREWDREREMNLVFRKSLSLESHVKQVEDLERKARSWEQRLRTTELKMEEVKARHTKAQDEWDTIHTALLSSKNKKTATALKLQRTLSVWRRNSQHDRTVQLRAYNLFALSETVGADSESPVSEDVTRELTKLNVRLEALAQDSPYSLNRQ